MIGDREPHMMRRGNGAPMTLLDCKLGEHTGHFAINCVTIAGRRVWACDRCLSKAQI